MDITKKYTDIILVPLEQEINNLRMGIYTKRFKSNKDKEYLRKMEQLLLDYYKKFELYIEK